MERKKREKKEWGTKWIVSVGIHTAFNSMKSSFVVGLGSFPEYLRIQLGGCIEAEIYVSNACVYIYKDGMRYKQINKIRESSSLSPSQLRVHQKKSCKSILRYRGLSVCLYRRFEVSVGPFSNGIGAGWGTAFYVKSSRRE